MDLYRVIQELREEKIRLEKAIAALEELHDAKAGEPGPAIRRRGRRFMPRAERLLVSERMKYYWSKRRRPERPKR
ncbi:MAG TPA: hypothetical protein VFA33_20520 [Bryobacteraceae bacterium]|nr:hypothetical protein [Bryobacteraceae bacterium]